MTPYIQSRGGMPGDVNMFAAMRGFEEMGFPCELFDSMGALEDAGRGDVVVGGVGCVLARLERLDCLPERIDYPEPLRPYLGRGVFTSSVGALRKKAVPLPVFVKSAETKAFTGFVAHTERDLLRVAALDDDFPVICSEPVDFVQEWRCFVMRGRILDVRSYGDGWREAFDPGVIDAAVAAYEDAPAGYAADFGVTRNGRTLLVEVNDGYSLGSYGLQRNLYAQLLSARWAELTGTNDECEV